MSQLRQFKDTSIAEAVIWDTTVKAPHVIIQKALAYALGRNMKPMFSIELSTRETALDFLVDNKNVSQEKANAIKAFDKLARILRSMDSLPLKIESLQAASSLYRCTDPLPLKKHKLCGPGRARANHSYKLFVPVIQCYAGLEASGRWPKDVESQKKTISAMALHVAISLEKGFGIRCVGTEDYIDIMYDGYAFRVALHASSGPSTLTADSISKSIRHHTAISGLATKYSSYCSVVQLARRWFGSHLMSLHVTQEVVELLVAEAFCNPSCLPTPASHWSGFLRFLQNVATFPWGERAMYVALMAGEMTASDHRAKIRQVESNYQRLREKSKFYLSTPYQADLQFWTDGHTASKACRHAVSAAKASMTFLNSEMPAGYTSFNQKILSLFTPNLKRHHVILRLHPESISLMKYFVCISEVNTKERKNQIADLVHLQSVTAAADNTDVKSKLIFGQNMVLEALRNVQKMLGKQAYVGYDEFGGTTAVISWNPSFFDPSLELQGGGGEEFTLPVDMSGRDPNILAVMTEVCTHLRGFVSDVNYS
jgi:U3 small nucleolar RNA-associated protein 22